MPQRPQPDSIHHQVLLFVRDRPEGVRRREVADAFLWVNLPTIDSVLASLRNKKLIYNDGVVGTKGSTWFPVTTDDIPEPFPEIAHDLVEELRKVHYDGQELYLAKRLHELFETPLN